MVINFFELKFHIGMSYGAPPKSGASNGSGHVGRSHGAPKFSSKSIETSPDHSRI